MKSRLQQRKHKYSTARQIIALLTLAVLLSPPSVQRSPLPPERGIQDTKISQSRVEAALSRAMATSRRSALGTWSPSPIRPNAASIVPLTATAAATPEWSAPQARNLARLHWQSGKQVQAQSRAQNQTVRFLEGWRLQEAATIPLPNHSLEETTAINLLNANAELFAIDAPQQEWQLAQSQADPLGFTQVHFTQTYEDLEVWPSSITVQISPQGHAIQVTAAYTPTPTDLNTTPNLDANTAAALALAHLKNQQPAFNERAELEDQQLLIHAPISAEPHLAYSLAVHQGNGLDWQVFVDAHSGEILTAFNHVCSAAVQGSGVDGGGNTQAIELWSENNEFYLVNTTKSMHDAQRSDPPAFNTTVGGILVFDAGNVSPQTNPEAFNPQLVTSTSAQAGFGPNAVSAAINLALVYDYFEARHQRLSIDGQGGNIIGFINVPINNAYWQNDVITFGNEDRWAHALDFAGHEMTHGVIEKTAGLIYENQPGALNEAFADIFGESVEAFHSNGTTDWKLGTLLAMPLRDMQNPGSLEIGLGRPFPSRMSEFIPPSDPFLDNFQGRDNGGVHLNSSIINHAFYQLAAGLPGAIGLPAAERIFYRALTTKLQKQSQFLDCRIACVQSAEELFGTGSTEARQTAEAFNNVEIFGQMQAPEPTPIPSVTGDDSTLFTAINALDGLTYLGRREAAQSDLESGTLLVNTPVAPGKRPVVSRDGTVALFVTAAFNVGVIDTLTGEGEIIGDPGSVWSVGLSPDGRYLGFVLASNNQPEDVIRVLDLETDAVEEYALKAPALDGGATDTILFADVMNFTPNGQVLYYDALNRITFADGSTIDSWSIYAIDRQTGNTISVVPPLPGLSIGNPSLGRSFVDHMVFEAGDVTTGQSHIFTQDLSTGTQTQVGVILATAGLAFPDFFGDDRAVLYSDYAFNEFGFLTGSGLTRQPLAEDGLTAQGDPAIWLLGTATGPTIGTIYRRGTFAGLSTIEVTPVAAQVTEGTGAPIEFTLQRGGNTSDPLSVEFVLTGTTTPGMDYDPIPLTATFEPNQTAIQINIPLNDDNLPEEAETLTLTLSSGSTYTLGASLSGTVTVLDDDEGGLSGYALWAMENGVGGPNDDFDNDGRRNLLEYAIGSDPKVADPGAVIVASRIDVAGQSHLRLTLPRTGTRPDVTYGFESSSNLSDWANATDQLVIIEDSATQLVVRQVAPITDSAQLYLRLRLDLN